MTVLFAEVRPSPAVSKRSVRSISPHRPSDSEDEDSTPSKHVPVIADIHEPTPSAAAAAVVEEDSNVQKDAEAEGDEKPEGAVCFYCSTVRGFGCCQQGSSNQKHSMTISQCLDFL